MNAETTIRRELAAIYQARALPGQAPEDECRLYGAAEALRWVLGRAPRPACLGSVAPQRRKARDA